MNFQMGTMWHNVLKKKDLSYFKNTNGFQNVYNAFLSFSNEFSNWHNVTKCSKKVRFKLIEDY